ncbi:MAG: hypothetical protein GC151_07670 [Betaproteobacteria bacterium]|nr:hypothetical protein [Betaproteobacteria bacterium]
MSAQFDTYVGIDYSGAETPERPLAGLQVYAASPPDGPERLAPPSARRHWSRHVLALWLRDEINSARTVLVGIDHGFSFPEDYFTRHGLDSWPAFLEDFARHWPTDEPGRRVDHLRAGATRTGTASELRLCERWTSSAKSVFQFDMQGSVAKSTHAGLPWLRWLRESCGDRLFFWPFDGWLPPPGMSVIAEVYPSLFRNRYPREGRSVDEQDAYAVARWLSEIVARDAAERYFNPPLTLAERRLAALEGWILGVN